MYLDLEIQDYEVDTISTRFKDYIESEFKVEVKDIFRNIALHRMVKEKEERVNQHLNYLVQRCFIKH